MPSFKQQKHKDLIDERYKGVAQVWVESTSDQKLLAEYLFPGEGEHMEFCPADGGGQGGGGCAAVIKEVKRAREDKVLAYGLVDRDVVWRLGADRQASMDVFLEPDEKTFREALDALDVPKQVRVLGAWEIESYLMVRHELLLREHRACGHTKLTSAELHQSLQELVELLIPDTAVKALCHIKGLSTFSRGHERKLNTRLSLRAVAKEHVQREHQRCLGAPMTDEDWDKAMDALEERVRRFDEGETDPERWWRKIARALDAKVLLKRFSASMKPTRKSSPGDEDMEELKYRLAQTFFDLSATNIALLDDELRGHIESFRPRAA